MIDKFILRGHEIVPEYDLLVWAEWIGTHRMESRVARTHLPDDTDISTVFLGLDHNFFGTGPPLLFETCIFTPKRYYSALLGKYLRESDIVERYSTWAEAEVGHMKWVEDHEAALSSRSSSDSSSS